MKIACWVAGLVFALFTYWQFNDLEQYGTAFWPGWVLTYGAASVVSFISAQRQLPRLVYGLASAVALAAAALRVLDIEWEKTVLYNETNPAGNESGGLFILGFWFLFLALKLKKPAAASASGSAQ